MVRYGRYVNYLLRGTVFSCTLEVQEVHYYCSVQDSVHKKNFILLPILLCWVKFTAHFACRIAYFFWLPILLKILLANFVKPSGSTDANWAIARARYPAHRARTLKHSQCTCNIHTFQAPYCLGTELQAISRELNRLQGHSPNLALSVQC